MQLMTSRRCLPFRQCSRARCRKLLQKISCNLGNIWNALSVTWLCDWKEHFIWRFAIFWCYWHYTITFPVIYHIVEYRDKFASPYIYHITEKCRDRFSQLLYTKWWLLLAGDIQQLFYSKISLEHILHQEDPPPQLFWNWDSLPPPWLQHCFPKGGAEAYLPFAAGAQSELRLSVLQRAPFSFGLWRQWCQDGGI